MNNEIKILPVVRGYSPINFCVFFSSGGLADTRIAHGH